MAVATPASVGQAERPRPATVASLDAPEEPVAMAEEPVVNDVTDEADSEPASVEASAETTEPAPEIAPEMTENEADAELTTEQPEEQAQEQTREQAQEQPVATGGLPPIEFNWTPMEFTPLAWRYDAEPEQQEIDLPRSTYGRKPGVASRGARRPAASRTTAPCAAEGEHRPRD
jgi:hypothetical protein